MFNSWAKLVAILAPPIGIVATIPNALGQPVLNIVLYLAFLLLLLAMWLVAHARRRVRRSRPAPSSRMVDVERLNRVPGAVLLVAAAVSIVVGALRFHEDRGGPPGNTLVLLGLWFLLIDFVGRIEFWISRKRAQTGLIR